MKAVKLLDATCPEPAIKPEVNMQVIKPTKKNSPAIVKAKKLISNPV